MIRAIKAVVSIVKKVGNGIRNNRVSRFIRNRITVYPAVRAVLVATAIIAPLAVATVVFPVAVATLWGNLSLILNLVLLTMVVCLIEASAVLLFRNLRAWYLYVTSIVRYGLTFSVTLLIVAPVIVPTLLVLGMTTMSFYLLNGFVI